MTARGIERVAKHRLLAPVLLLAISCNSAPPEPQAAAPAVEAPEMSRIVRMAPSAARTAGIRIGSAASAQIPETIEVAGRVTLDEDRTARVGSFVEGVVIDCCKSVGTYVRKGAVLAEVHSHTTHEIVAPSTSASGIRMSRPPAG